MTDSDKNKPILVTGSHRSGSTWIGKMLSLSDSVGYIQEPFHLYHPLGINATEFDYWYQYICKENDKQYNFSGNFKDTLNFKYKLSNNFKCINSGRDVLRMIWEYGYFTKARLLSRRPLVKDPLAFFSVEYLADNFDMDVVIIIRHPAAFTASLKSAGWEFPIDHLLKQNLLLDKHLGGFKEDFIEYTKEKKSLVDQAALFWNAIYKVALDFQERNNNFIFIKHEDVSLDPVGNFRTLYEKLDLDFSKEIEGKIEQTSKRGKKTLHNRLGLIATNINRDSAYNVKAWKNKLTADEIFRVKEKTSDIAKFFYSEHDWV